MLADVSPSGVVVHDPTVCTGCGICELMCSLYHEGLQSPSLARLQLVKDHLTNKVSVNVCQQCLAPSCYFACPRRGEALCIDTETGARYVNEGVCTDCLGHYCAKACPFEPPMIRLNAKKRAALKCDLCRGREEGPICVEYCPSEALKFISKDNRTRGEEYGKILWLGWKNPVG